MTRPSFRAAARALVLFLGVALATTVIARADTYTAPNFTVYNEGSETISAINVSPHGNNAWGDDLLGNYELQPGYNYKPLVNYTLPSCYQDVRAVYDNQHVETMYNINICTQNVIFKY